MADDVLEGQLGDPERRCLDLAGRPRSRPGIRDLDRDADVGALLRALGELLDGREEAEFLQHDGPPVGGEIVELVEDVAQRRRELVRGAATFGLGEGSTDGRHDVRMQLDRDPRPFGGRGAAGTGLARCDLVDEDPDRLTHRRRRLRPGAPVSDGPPAGGRRGCRAQGGPRQPR